MGSSRLFHSLLFATVVAKTLLKRAMVITADTAVDRLVDIPDGKVVASTTSLACSGMAFVEAKYSWLTLPITRSDTPMLWSIKQVDTMLCTYSFETNALHGEGNCFPLTHRTLSQSIFENLLANQYNESLHPLLLL
jgi:hypothetical protein